MSVGRGAGPSLTKTQPAWHVDYFIYIDNLSPVSLSWEQSSISRNWKLWSPTACPIVLCCNFGSEGYLLARATHFKVEFTNNWLVKEIRSYCYSVQGIRDQKKWRYLTNIYIYNILPLSDIDQQKETERKKSSDRKGKRGRYK